MHHPTHPGSILREDLLMPIELNVSKAAEVLGVNRTPRFAMSAVPSLPKWRCV